MKRWILFILVQATATGLKQHVWILKDVEQLTRFEWTFNQAEAATASDIFLPVSRSKKPSTNVMIAG